MVLLKVLGYGEYGFSTVGVVAVLANASGIQGQNYVVLIQENEMTAGLYYMN